MAPTSGVMSAAAEGPSTTFNSTSQLKVQFGQILHGYKLEQRLQPLICEQLPDATSHFW